LYSGLFDIQNWLKDYFFPENPFWKTLSEIFLLLIAYGVVLCCFNKLSIWDAVSGWDDWRILEAAAAVNFEIGSLASAVTKKAVDGWGPTLPIGFATALEVYLVSFPIFSTRSPGCAFDGNYLKNYNPKL